MLEISIHKTVNSIRGFMDIAHMVNTFSTSPGVRSVHITLDTSVETPTPWRISHQPLNQPEDHNAEVK